MTLSREEKNKQLHEQLISDPESDIVSNDLEKIANRLNRIDKNNFEEMNTSKTSVNPQHASSNEKPKFFNQESMDFSQDFNEPLPKFNNEYLDEFINEVKQYNIKNGNRTSEDTQSAIFNSILNKSYENKKPETKKSKPVYEELDNQVDSIELNKEIEVKEEPVLTTPEVKDETFKSSELKLEIEKLLNSEEVTNPDNVNDIEVTQEILAQTSSLKKQMEDYDTKLTKVDDRMNKVNKSLNIILIVLFTALIALLGVIIFFVLKSKGIIQL